MAMYALPRVNKHRMGAVTAIEKHHERMKEAYKSNPDIDCNRTDLNFHLLKPDGKYRDVILRRIRQVGAKPRSNSIMLQDGLIFGTPEWIKGKTDAEQMEFFRYAYAFIENRFGKENMISAVVHMDEATPHIHFCFVPITKDGRLSSKDVIGGPKGLRKFQDDFYAYISQKYPELSRGIPKELSHRTHVPTYMYKQAAELYKHYEEICAAIADIGLIANGKKKEEAIALIGRYAPEMARMKASLEQTDRQIHKLENQLQDSKSCAAQLEQLTEEKRKELEDSKRKIYQLNYQQKLLLTQVQLVPPDLMKQLEADERRRRRAERKERR